MHKTSKYAALGAVVLALTACGGGGDEGSGGDAADVPLSQAPAVVQQYAGLFNAARGQSRNCGAVAAPAVQPLTKWNPSLQASAQKHADDMASKNFFSHTGSDGSDVNSRANSSGYQGRPISENLMKGRGSPEQLVRIWLDSQGHCLGIMADLAHSVALAQSGEYTVMVFGD